jgi:glycosyltransferase involved in cell wall biosynthesis
MRIALVADTFPPLQTSGAVQLRDLSNEFVKQGHEITVILPSAEIKHSWLLEDIGGVKIIRLRAPKMKDVNYIRRTFAEFLMPFFMIRNLHKSPFSKVLWDGVVWYSPSIFLGPLVNKIKKSSNCKGYLIIRDIFPEWAADMGLMKRKGLAFRFFNRIAHYQYSVADIIGVQAIGNLSYFKDWAKGPLRRLEVLQNWLFDSSLVTCTISLSKTKLVGRKIFVYAGNMGVAQNVGRFLDLAELLKERSDIGFLFVGRGSDAKRLADDSRARKLGNVLFHDEIHPNEIPGLYAQCDIGLVALDPRHKSHNIPGKFLTYMQSGLPVLALINSGNDLIDIINSNGVGKVSTEECSDSLGALALELVNSIESGGGYRERCRNLYLKVFSPKNAVHQISSALSCPV